MPTLRSHIFLTLNCRKSMKNRKIGKEKLDSLPASHPHALANRRDLQFFNRLMCTGRWFERSLPRSIEGTGKILELGAGDGSLSNYLLCHHATSSAWQWHSLDIQQVPARKSNGLHWHEADLMQFGDYHSYEVVFGNLILHQFNETQLSALGEKLQQGPRALIFQDLRRSSIVYWGSRFITLFMHSVTRHDAPLSVRAGFRGNELVEQLGLASKEWTISLEYSPLGAYRMVANRF